jgi:hypothetical protein
VRSVCVIEGSVHAVQTRGLQNRLPVPILKSPGSATNQAP